MTEPRFYVPLDTAQVISEMLFPANLLASTKKAKPNRIKATIPQKNKNTIMQNKHTKKTTAKFGCFVRPLDRKVSMLCSYRQND